MRFLLDENFPVSIVDVIEQQGHEAVEFSDVCAYGDDDGAVFDKAQQLQAVLLTSDRDFYHTMPLLHPKHCGIVVVALRQPNRRAVAERVNWFLSHYHEPMDNTVVLLRDYSWRVKR